MRPLIRVVFPDTLPLAATGRRNAAGRLMDRLTADVDVWIELWDGRRLLLTTIRAGFETDGVSWPRWAFWTSPWDGTSREAVLHDWLLTLLDQGLIDRPKILIDLIFLLAMLSNGVSFPRAFVEFFGVRTKGYVQGHNS